MAELGLAVVTSSHGYGRYLEEWAASLLDLTIPPREVCLFTHGEAGDVAFAASAVEMLQRGGFPVKHQHHPERLDFGTARNQAVGMSATPWVMHLDADDTLMPHALEDVAELMAGADVVALGYRRSGDLTSGPRQRVKLYRSTTGAETLATTSPCSGVSPFRRSFWERAPYRTDLHGGWDTALWLGFARLGARIRATRRPCFWYRQHADSIFNTRRVSGWPAARAGGKLQSLRRGDDGVAVLIPWAGDEPIRERNLAHVRRWYAEHFPSWEVRLGQVPLTEGWRKGRAVEMALKGSTAAVLVIADGDCLLAPEALLGAVQAVQDGSAPWVVPHGQVHRLTEAQTQGWLTSELTRQVEPPDGKLDRQPYLGRAGGGLLVVGRSDFVAAGGIPPEFVGWGGEDEALGVILDTLVGHHMRGTAPLVHLWHPPQPGRTGTGYQKNRERWRRYVHAQGDVAAMWALVQGGGAHHLGSHTAASERHLSTHSRALAFRSEVTTMVRDIHARQKLANQREGRDVGLALDLKRRHIQTIREQEARNAAGPQGLRAGRTEGKALLQAPANKMQPADLSAVKFASSAAEKAAKEAGLSAQQLRSITPTSKGITLSQVRELVP